MKNFKKILSLVVVLTMIFSISAFALDWDEEINFKIDVTETASKDDEITVKVYSDNKTGTDDLLSFYLDVYYDTTAFEYVSSTVTGAKVTTNANEAYEGLDTRIAYQIDNDPAVSYDYSNLTTITFKVIAEPTSDTQYNFYLRNVALSGSGYETNMNDEALVNDADVITVKSGSTVVTYPTLSNDTFTEGEEVFEGYTATAAATGITVFQKTAEDLAAESYGIQVVTGGKTYKFPGKVAITLGEATEKIWGIKIVAPAGTFQDGAAFAPTSIKAYVGTTLSDELVSAN